MAVKTSGEAPSPILSAAPIPVKPVVAVMV
jgi:hypothetical protein